MLPLEEPGAVEYTLVLPEADALALVLGDVPLTVKVAILSGFKAMHETPADFVSKPRKRKKAA